MGIREVRATIDINFSEQDSFTIYDIRALVNEKNLSGMLHEMASREVPEIVVTGQGMERGKKFFYYRKVNIRSYDDVAKVNIKPVGKIGKMLEDASLTWRNLGVCL